MLKNPRITFDQVWPDGTRVKKEGEVTGYIKDREQLVHLLQHPAPNSSVENLVVIGDDRKPLDPQPPEILPSPAPAIPPNHVITSEQLQAEVAKQ